MHSVLGYHLLVSESQLLPPGVGQRQEAVVLPEPRQPRQVDPDNQTRHHCIAGHGSVLQTFIYTGEENDGRNVWRCDGDHKEEEEEGAGDVDEEDDPGPGGQPHLYISVDFYAVVSRYLL